MSEPAVYEIRIRGHLDKKRVRQFEGLTVTHHPSGVTVFKGTVVDQAALFGLLALIRDSGAPLLLVKRL